MKTALLWSMVLLLLAALLTLSACSASSEPDNAEPMLSASDEGFFESEADIEVSSDAAAIARIFGSCEMFDMTRDESADNIFTRYSQLVQQGKQEGYTPVIIIPNARMADNVYNNLDLLSYKQSGYDTVPDALIQLGVDEITERAGELNSARVLAELKAEREDNFSVSAFRSKKGSMEGGCNSLSMPEGEHEWGMIVKVEGEPWRVLAEVPIGGWNECPAALRMVVIARSWYEQYGALPALISEKELQFRLEQSAPESECRQLAVEQYCFAPDSKLFKKRSAQASADYLSRSTVWRFRWVRS